MTALAQTHGAINLGQGFPDTEGPPALIEAAAAALRDGRNQYAPLTGVPELRQAVAAANRRFYGLAIDPDAGVLITAGATEGLLASLTALLDPGDDVVLIEPLFDTYLPVIRLLGATPRLVRLRPPHWRLDTDELAAAFTARTKALLLNTPHNPTGKVFTTAELETIADLLRRHDAYAVCDEVYEHLVFAPARHIPLMTLPGMAERTLRIGSAGKTFSVTGWKVGYISGPPALVRTIARAHQNTVFSVPPNLQRAVALGLGFEDAYFASLGDTLAAKRDRLAAGLAQARLTLLPTEGTYFAIADIAHLQNTPDDLAFARTLAEQHGVATIPLSPFYASNPPRTMIRFAFCKRDEVLDEACGRLRAKS